MNISNEVLEAVIREVVEEQLSGKQSIPTKTKSIPIGVSARHLHVTQEHLEILFGSGAKLTPKKELMGGQFAAEERVTIVGKSLRAIENVRILGPVRSETQVEVSKTDSIKLGINPPIRESGNIIGSAPISIVGPKGVVYLEEACILAKRHIHMNENDAKYYNVKDNDIVSVEIEGERKSIFHNVQVRVNPSYSLEMHIDTDEANGAGVSCGSMANIISK